MKRVTINRSDIQGPFVTPPANGGQIVTVSYAQTEDYILERTYDASDRSESIIAYRQPARGSFSPQNGTPKLGRRAGTAVIV